MRHARRLGRVMSLAGLALLLAGGPDTAGAESLPFAFVIRDGLKLAPLALGPDKPTVLVAGPRAIHPIANGQIDPGAVGTATIILWDRTVPDPFFAPFGPVAGLGILDFGPPLNLVAHLGLIGTPAGTRTTIGVNHNVGGSFTPSTEARGEWVVGNAAALPGGTADDLLLAGVLILGQAAPLGGQGVEMDPYFPTVPFASDPKPFTACAAPPCLGSFYGQAVLGGLTRPIRTYTLATGGSQIGRWANLGVIHAGGDSYLVVACSSEHIQPPPVTQVPCTLSGTGTIDQAVSGGGSYASGPGLSTTFFAQPTLVFP